MKEEEVFTAKSEFIEHKGNRKIKCASIQYEIRFDKPEQNSFDLHCNYTKTEYAKWLKSLDFEYDNGFGGQMLFGTIWYTDGTWSERSEYDGSEWWEYKQLPEIPKELL